MTALLRALRLPRSHDALSLSQSHHTEPVEHIGGPIAMGTVGLCSFLATLSLLVFLTYRFVFWRRYYKRPLAENQYVLLIYNLLLADVQQAAAFMVAFHWAAQRKVTHPSAACVAQGWLIQVADPGSGLWVLAIAVHTTAVVMTGKQLPYRAFVFCVIGLWMFIILLGLIPVGLYGPETFVISESGWCWLSPSYLAERIWTHYLWIFLVELSNLLLYGTMFFYLQHRMRQARALHQNRSHLARMNRVVVYMVIYPLVYLCLSLPLAAGRMATATGNVLSKRYFAIAGCLMALSGFVDVLVYTLTRRHVVLDADSSRDERVYDYYSHNSVFQTHTSIAGAPGVSGKMKDRRRKRSRLRRGWGSNMRVEDDGDHRGRGDGDSTEDIVRKDDLELNHLAHGVYQETTIEISHEPIESAERSRRSQHE